MSWTHTRSQIAVAKKKNPHADVSGLQRQLRAERLAEHVAKVVSEAPPLTAAQRDRVAALLRCGA